MNNTMTRPTRLVLAGVLAVLVIGMMPFATALPAQAAEQAHSHAHDNTHDNAQELPEQAANADSAADETGAADVDRPDARELPEQATDRVEERGPSADLPDQVPDHVRERHDIISAFLSGDLEGTLGEHMRDLADALRGTGQ